MDKIKIALYSIAIASLIQLSCGAVGQFITEYTYKGVQKNIYNQTANQLGISHCHNDNGRPFISVQADKDELLIQVLCSTSNQYKESVN